MHRAFSYVMASPAILGCLACSPTPTRGSKPPSDGDRSSVVAPAGERAPLPLPEEAGIYYTFDVAPDLSAVDADVCFVGPRPHKMVAPTTDAIPLLREVTNAAGPVVAERGAISLRDISDGECIHYRVDTTAALDADDLRGGASFVNRDALLSPDWWLWAPEGGSSPPAFARFLRSDGPRPAMPWPRASRGAFDWHIPQSAFVWKAQGAFARRAPSPLTVGNSTLDVIMLGDGFDDREPAVVAWLGRSANAVHGLLGAFPLDRAQLLLVPIAHRSGSFGYVLRGGGPSATMLLPNAPTDAALQDDWTAVHELFHFAHPPMATAESWFYEGLATYLTALARARSGMTSKAYGWWELLDGFERGSRVGTGQTLRDECKTMHQNRTYWRVYWSGAAMLLQIDIELHKRGTSLEAGIASLARAKLDDTHRWTAEELMTKLDEHCGCDVPSRVTAQHLDHSAFPNVATMKKQLGVEVGGDRRVVYDNNAPDVAIRRAIMGGD